MKELYLIPKHQFEVLSNKNHVNSKGNNITSKPKITNMVKTPNLVRSNKPKTIKRKVPLVGQQWGTRLLPPPIQKPVHMKGIKYSYKETSKNPNINQQLSMKFFGKNLSHARILLDHLDKSGLVEYNEYGDIFQPINGYNIVDFIEDIISNDKISAYKFEDYKYIVNFTNIPLHFIKNKEFKNYLSQSVKPMFRGVGKKVKKSKSIQQQQQQQQRWSSY